MTATLWLSPNQRFKAGQSSRRSPDRNLDARCCEDRDRHARTDRCRDCERSRPPDPTRQKEQGGRDDHPSAVSGRFHRVDRAFFAVFRNADRIPVDRDVLGRRSEAVDRERDPERSRDGAGVALARCRPTQRPSLPSNPLPIGGVLQIGRRAATRAPSASTRNRVQRAARSG